MRSKLAIKYIITIIFVCSVFIAQSQILYNNGTSISITNSAILQVNGSLLNDTSGSVINDGDLNIINDITNNAAIEGDGNYNISGDWINNNTFTPELSNVYLNGADQFIAGTVSTTFNNLDLSGTGIKTLQINTNLSGILSLNDRELATDDFIMFVLNTDLSAITRTTGFVSSLNNGNLSRATLNNSTYEFPVGSSIGTLRYRPVNILPSSASANTFTVRMANNDATSDGYDRTLLGTGLCSTNPDYYHRINRTAGTDPADITIFYDEIADGYWSGAAQWDIAPSTLWENMGTAIVTTSTPFNDVTVQNWSDFTTDPYILTLDAPVVIAGSNSAICEGEDLLLTETGGSAISWSWTGPNGFSSSSQDTSITEATPSDNGLYTVVVTDGTGCTSSSTVNVTINPIPTIIPASNSAICAGEDLTLSETGSMATTWAWSGPNGFTSNVQNPTIVGATTLASGIYMVTGTIDSTGCTSQNFINVLVNSAPTIDSILTANIDCFGDSNGGIGIFASNASQYSIDNGINFYSDSIFTGLAVGTYDIVIIDTSSCQFDTTVTITGPTQALASNYTTTEISCYGLSDGEIHMSTNGGTPLYTYTWAPVGGTANDSVYSGLSATTYSVTITDANGCSMVIPKIDITEPDELTISLNDFSPLCFGDASGGVTSTVYGGTTPYTYLWNNSSTDSVLTNVSSGSYILVVTDGHNCTAIDTVSITNPSEIITTITDTVGSDYTGSVDLTVSGGNLPYTYEWSNGSIDEDIVGLDGGLYIVTITDGTLCTVTDSVLIEIPLIIPTLFTPNNDGFNDNWRITNIGEYENISIEIFNRWGDVIYTYSGSGYEYNNLPWDGTYNGQQLPISSFVYIINLNNGEDPYDGVVSIKY